MLAIQNMSPLDGPKKKDNIWKIMWKIRAKKVVLATGSIERFLTFDNNDNFIVLNNSSGISVQGGTKSKKNLIDIFAKSKIFQET